MSALSFTRSVSPPLGLFPVSGDIEPNAPSDTKPHWTWRWVDGSSWFCWEGNGLTGTPEESGPWQNTTAYMTENMTLADAWWYDDWMNKPIACQIKGTNRKYLLSRFHDMVASWQRNASWWRHYMHFPRYWPFVREIQRSPVNSPHKGQWCGSLLFSLICAWTNGWFNKWYIGDLRRNCVHYDVTVISVHCYLWG